MNSSQRVFDAKELMRRSCERSGRKVAPSACLVGMLPISRVRIRRTGRQRGFFDDHTLSLCYIDYKHHDSLIWRWYDLLINIGGSEPNYRMIFLAISMSMSLMTTDTTHTALVVWPTFSTHWHNPWNDHGVKWSLAHYPSVYFVLQATY